MALLLRDAYQFLLSGMSEQEQKLLAATFSQARKTANSWKAVDLQLTAAATAAGAGASPLADAKRLASLKPLVRRGIPYELRPTQWHLMSGAAARQAAAGPGAYARLASAAASKDTQLTLAEDLSVGCFSFRSHPVFRRPSSLEALRRIMCAYLAHTPAGAGGGYFRGLAHVAGFVLIVMGGPAAEEEAFWVLTTLLQDKVFGHCAGQASYGLKVECGVLDALVAKKLPNVAATLAKLGTSSGAVLAPWLGSLFTDVLPSEVTARVFDALLLEGSKVLLRTSLALLKTYESTINASSHPAQLRKVLDTRARRLYDGEALMCLAFSSRPSVNPLPGRMVAGMRAASAAAVDAQLAEQSARLEMLLCRTQ